MNLEHSESLTYEYIVRPYNDCDKCFYFIINFLNSLVVVVKRYCYQSQMNESFSKF